MEQRNTCININGVTRNRAGLRYLAPRPNTVTGTSFQFSSIFFPHKKLCKLQRPVHEFQSILVELTSNYIMFYKNELAFYCNKLAIRVTNLLQ